MERSLAGRMISELVLLSQEVHQPIVLGIPDLSHEDRQLIRHAITEVWGSIYFDLMRPIVRQYPDLDPDQDEVPKDVAHTADVRGPDSKIARTQLAHAIVAAADAGAARLTALIESVGRGASEDEAARLRTAAADVYRGIHDLRAIGVRWLGEDSK